VNLILNAEPDSAAAERFEMSGPGVCAMALRVDDPDRAAARAEALLCPVFDERIGAGEARIPAIRAPDGSLVYLVAAPAPGTRPDWEGDFVLHAPAGDALGIDHVAQALAPGMLDSFVLFYRAVLGLAPEALWELPDPYGLVRSRAFSGGGVRLPLNVSEAGRTGTGRFVSALAGAGVHHIAIAVAEAATGQGMLDIPPEYYEDLGARFGLDDTALDALRHAHLLYDEDTTGGTFRHAYTQPFHDRFFFEIASRTGTYAGYGAANAGTRMAAQRRSRGGG
jgi:4-hydroxyphenylpyruvate dioxygenase